MAGTFTRLSVLLAKLLIVKFMGVIHAQPIHVPGIFMLVAGELECLSHHALVVDTKFAARQEDEGAFVVDVYARQSYW